MWGRPVRANYFWLSFFDMGDMDGVYRHHGGYLCVIIFLYQWEGRGHSMSPWMDVTMDATMDMSLTMDMSPWICHHGYVTMDMSSCMSPWICHYVYVTMDMSPWKCSLN